ncbi:unnamed protein product [Oppiella nova]|uniref:G-protein coupled receptors family 2 profile 2 domain-containing protein n=1 Tax=Oppiella nova TaxID=334625 RepID=A0A7R9QC32_9ACAR|nr:unnamed protein product [Oppiella nova]CAG2162899.1 unnamed protein product [Oppiella nova]
MFKLGKRKVQLTKIYRQSLMCSRLRVHRNLVVISMKLYAALACINWMFIEGLLLHSRITVSIFRKDAPFKLYYCIGWVALYSQLIQIVL